MKFEDFEALAWEYWERIPDTYKEGVDGLVVERDALPHPTLPEIYTLGECLTESYPSGFGGPDTVRSAVVLYYGSFRRLAALDREFDWEAELWETLTHELKHHLEWLADEDALEAMDRAADENFKRVQGEPFDPYFYRSGEPVAERVYRVEGEFFMELEQVAGDAAPWLEFGWHGQRFRVPQPESVGDVCYILVESGVDAGPAGLTLVLLRRRGLGAGLRALLAGRRPVVVELEAVAEPLD